VRTILGRTILAGLLVLSCTSAPGGGSPLEAGVVGRIPANHRPGGATCPRARGPGALTPGCNYDSGALACRTDGDCTAGDAGSTGRCLPAPGVACAPACSYDACFSDTDCSGKPCACRASGSDSAANVCLTGNCAVDADCGPGGYCSPSGLPDACGLGYYCHTPGDGCVDNADCPSSEGCSFDPHQLAWACSVTCTRPP
jgi:hypothetical protein